MESFWVYHQNSCKFFFHSRSVLLPCGFAMMCKFWKSTFIKLSWKFNMWKVLPLSISLYTPNREKELATMWLYVTNMSYTEDKQIFCWKIVHHLINRYELIGCSFHGKNGAWQKPSIINLLEKSGIYKLQVQ